MLATVGIGFLAAAMVATTVFGVVAIRTQWMLPWLRRSTLRPVLWGWATLSGSAGLGLWCVAVATERVDAFGLAGLILIVTDTVLSYLATRPGRVTTP
ncbi:hypothetical protein ACSCB1_16425 [Streptomyces europaeiscabiei]|uniref:hypothetical protein n=1 Tax=Streptomyces TaxID=1883 RepID=UPI00062834AC|nr:MULTISPECIES: hypothetical protein [Streptomyces]MBP5891227.1 hypothetical protein [Streptomyces sp. LBUM 1481]MBP5921380.1 hypothetical protein [Streptomyces sp. LBUM 1483]MDX2525932.1 hypothetical protein [Streptomyces europaeiscabiei]MDX2690895.1 hypothetical protein [Streptomyces scabiei]MDX2756016.1 hypothetical protein [Streptomyces scabiei]